MRTVVTAWYGTFVLDPDGTVVRSERVPDDPEALADRALRRRSGELTSEEKTVLSGRGEEEWVTSDRRLAAHGLRFDPSAPASPPAGTAPESSVAFREALLRAAERGLEMAWDPSVHLEEAVRAVADLDRVQNLVGERLLSWVGRDAPEVDPYDTARAVRSVLENAGESRFAPTEPTLREARRRLAELYAKIGDVHAELERAVESAAPNRAANLTHLLGPDLTARLLASAGGLDRLSRLPASTVQVLGAERAFFEHLRGRAPPPRHGLLFLHPTIQSAPRSERGKLARALAGKAAIAARRDRVGAPVTEELLRAYEERRRAIQSRRREKPRARERRRSRTPLHRAPLDR